MYYLLILIQAYHCTVVYFIRGWHFKVIFKQFPLIDFIFLCHLKYLVVIAQLVEHRMYFLHFFRFWGDSGVQFPASPIQSPNLQTLKSKNTMTHKSSQFQTMVIYIVILWKTVWHIPIPRTGSHSKCPFCIVQRRFLGLKLQFEPFFTLSKKSNTFYAPYYAQNSTLRPQPYSFGKSFKMPSQPLCRGHFDLNMTENLPNSLIFSLAVRPQGTHW